MNTTICETEKMFLVEGFKFAIRRDGRSNLEARAVQIVRSTIPHGFGSATLKFGEEETMIIVSIKAEVCKPLSSESNKGQIRFHIESS